MRSTLVSYITGFVLSIVLTIVAFKLVTDHILAGQNLIYALVGLALAQMLVQLIFFLHLGRENRPYWNLTALISTAGVVLIVIVGSLLIMGNLKYRHEMPTSQEIIQDEGINK